MEKVIIKTDRNERKRKLPINLTIVPPNEGNVPWEIFLPLKEKVSKKNINCGCIIER